MRRGEEQEIELISLSICLKKKKNRKIYSNKAEQFSFKKTHNYKNYV